LFLPARVAAAVAKIFLYAKEPTVKRMQDRIKKKKDDDLCQTRTKRIQGRIRFCALILYFVKKIRFFVFPQTFLLFFGQSNVFFLNLSFI